jgi:SWI/SNF related-matrix-associated actin-dependent regulator of chromatin subfamily C
MFSGDFVKLVSSAPGVSQGNGLDDDWSDQEVLLLLEGVEMFDDDWSRIEEHVGTRSAQQCIKKFLALPIEDPYLQTEGSMGPLRFARIPFEQADNPVMSVVAFLAGVVGPGVAAEAAKTALHELKDVEAMPTENGKDAKAADGEAVNGEKPAESSADAPMDEDAPKEDGAADAEGSMAVTPAPPAGGEADADGMLVDSPAAKKKTTLPQSQVVRAADLALKASAKAARALADQEDANIRSTLATLIKLSLTKLELKMTQFEELEEILEEERRGMESARLGLAQERLGLKNMLDSVKAEIAKHGSAAAVPPAMVENVSLGTTSQGTEAKEVAADAPVEGDSGPVTDGAVAALA